jgi:uncharacterized protein (TIRG00374 family)
MKRLFSILISLAILVVIYWKIDFVNLLQVLKNSDPFWMAASLSMVVPLTMLTAWRLQLLLPENARFSTAEANRLILVASVLNMVLPSKMGDIAKAYFIKQQTVLDGSVSLSLVVFEKALDMLSLLAWCLFGLLVYQDKTRIYWLATLAILFLFAGGTLLLTSRAVANSFFAAASTIIPDRWRLRMQKLSGSWTSMQQYFKSDKAQVLRISFLSLFIWFLHLFQIWLFIFALKASTPLLANLALAPLAILAGLLPLTFAGIGTRDAALIFFYKPYLSPAVAAALGLLCTARYLLPAIGGLPFLGQYLTSFRKRVELQTPQTNGTR